MVDNLDNEIWKTIECFGDGLFEVSNKGRVKKLAYSFINPYGRRCSYKETLVKCHFREIKGRGYGYVTLCYRRKTKHYSIHSLVAKAFIENPDNKPEVNHIDGNKHNNYVENLEWVTRAENMYHAKYAGLIKPCIGETHWKSIKVCAYDFRTGTKLATFESALIAGKFCNVNSDRHILECCRGEKTYAYGYIWKFCEKESVTTNENC